MFWAKNTAFNNIKHMLQKSFQKTAFKTHFLNVLFKCVHIICGQVTSSHFVLLPSDFQNKMMPSGI